MTKVLCTADNHLGYRQYGILERERDLYKSFEKLLDLAIAMEVDAITVSGDLLHTNRPTSATIAFLKECNNKLMDSKIPAFVVAGNHDQAKPNWLHNLCDSGSYTEGVGGFFVLENEHVQVGTMKIFGAPFTNKNDWHTNVYEKVPQDTDILLMHQSFNEFIDFKTEDGFCADDVKDVAKHVVVGDIHITKKVGNIISPGSSELISSTESDVKYVVLIDDSVEETKFIKISTRRVIKEVIASKDHLDMVIEELARNKHVNPLVFLECDFSLSGGIERIKDLYEHDMLIRAKYYNPEVKETLNKESEVSLEEVLDKFISSESDVYPLAKTLLSPDCDARFEIESYIDSKLGGP